MLNFLPRGVWRWLNSSSSTRLRSLLFFPTAFPPLRNPVYSSTLPRFSLFVQRVSWVGLKNERKEGQGKLRREGVVFRWVVVVFRLSDAARFDADGVVFQTTTTKKIPVRRTNELTRLRRTTDVAVTAHTSIDILKNIQHFSTSSRLKTFIHPRFTKFFCISRLTPTRFFFARF